MSILLVFVALVIVGDAIAVGIAYQLEQLSSTVSLMTFFALYVLVFYVAWRLAVFLVERYLVKEPNNAA